MENTVKNTKALRVVFGDFAIGVHGKGFDYIFSYARGGLESIKINNEEFVYRMPRPAFWRALTDNDRGNKFHLRSGQWLAADMFCSCTDIKVFKEGEDITDQAKAPNTNAFNGDVYTDSVKVVFTYETVTVPVTLVNISYEVKSDGSILTEMEFKGNKELPELPVLGVRFLMPFLSDGFSYEGLSGETYPDRIAGGVEGVYEVEGLPVTPYVVPQDCGMHMETKWVQVMKPETKAGLRFQCGDEKFAFSCLPYTASELENAYHHEELPPKRRTVLSLFCKVRGVGGIDSWGADVLEAYRVPADRDYNMSFTIKPIID